MKFLALLGDSPLGRTRAARVADGEKEEGRVYTWIRGGLKIRLIGIIWLDIKALGSRVGK